MAKRGRKSAASNVVALDVTRARPRISPPSILTQQERALFVEVVTNNVHLRPADSQMLAAYVQALARTYRLARKTDAASNTAWKESGRLALAMARSLRLTAINLTHKTTVARQHGNAASQSYYDMNPMSDEDDD